MQNKIIALWAHPRSLSTVTERIFIERGDLHVIHEPFSYLYYVIEGKGTAEIAEKEVDEPKDYVSMRNKIIAAAETEPVFFKDMPHHCFRHIMEDDDFLQHMTPIFLIREPSESIESHYAMNPDVTREEIGYEHQYQLFEKVRQLKGQPPIVIDAGDLQDDPEGVIRVVCERLGLAFIPEALTWQQGQRKEWKDWEKWHQDAANSTGIQRLKKKYEVTVENNAGLKAFYDYHLPFYQALFQHRSVSLPRA